jgi:hypothetical protein
MQAETESSAPDSAPLMPEKGNIDWDAIAPKQPLERRAVLPDKPAYVVVPKGPAKVERNIPSSAQIKEREQQLHRQTQSASTTGMRPPLHRGRLIPPSPDIEPIATGPVTRGSGATETELQVSFWLGVGATLVLAGTAFYFYTKYNAAAPPLPVAAAAVKEVVKKAAAKGKAHVVELPSV